MGDVDVKAVKVRSLRSILMLPEQWRERRSSTCHPQSLAWVLADNHVNGE